MRQTIRQAAEIIRWPRTARILASPRQAGGVYPGIRRCIRLPFEGAAARIRVMHEQQRSRLAARLKSAPYSPAFERRETHDRYHRARRIAPDAHLRPPADRHVAWPG